jgi:RES domain-containing protein
VNLAALRRLRPGVRPPQTRWHRMVDERWAESLDETAQTVLRAWRWNPAGEFGVLYLSKSADCCRREKLRQVGGNPDFLPPQVVGTFEVKLRRCLDLTSPKVLRALSLTREEFIAPDSFTKPQAVARAARRLGFAALIVPSAIGLDYETLVVFKDKLAPPSSCILL